MATNNYSKNKSEALFDTLFRRKALTPIQENVRNDDSSTSKRPTRKAKNQAIDSIINSSLTKKSKRRKSKQKVHFNDEESKDYLSFQEPVRKYTKKAKKKEPRSVSDAVYDAYVMSNLPDFDALPELNVVEVNNWEVDIQPEKPQDPRVEDLLAVFEDTTSSSRKVMSKSLNGSAILVKNKRHCMVPQDFSSPVRPTNSIVEATSRKNPSVSALVEDIILDTPPPKEASIHEDPTPQPHNITSLEDMVTPEDSITPEAITAIENFSMPPPPPPRISSIRETIENPSLNLNTHLTTLPALHGHHRESFRNVPQSTPLQSRKIRPPKRSFIMSTISPNATAFKRNIASTTRATSKNFSHVSTMLRTDFSKLHRTIVPVNTSNGIRKTFSTLPSSIHSALSSSFAVAFAETSVLHSDGREDILTNEEKVLAMCSPPEIAPFSSIFTPQLLQYIKKLGEGSYGEVYGSKSVDGSDIVLKIIPFDTFELDSTEEAFEKLLPELVIFNTFNQLSEGQRNRTPNFIRWIHSSCLRGSFPQELLNEWDAYDEKKQSENLDPRKYTKDSLHLVVVTNNGGVDLESFKLNSAEQALSIFLQVTFSLASAEAEFQFEHRDLHWGNILVSKTDQEQIEYLVNGMSYDINSSGIMVQIIDFTLSRITKDGYVVFSDLADQDDLFTGLGKEAGKKGDYQFDIYRYMKEENNNNWQVFTPKTNVLWLDYLMDKLINVKKYRSRNKEHKKMLDILKDFHPFVKAAPSVSSLVSSSFMSDLLTKISNE